MPESTSSLPSRTSIALVVSGLVAGAATARLVGGVVPTAAVMSVAAAAILIDEKYR